MIHLDTSFLIDLLRERHRRASGPAHRALQGLAEEELAISVHVACELHAAAESSRNAATEHARVAELCSVLEVIPADSRFPPMYAQLFGELRRRGETVATMDLLIATAARVDGAQLVTRNARDFERIPGLQVLAYGGHAPRGPHRPSASAPPATPGRDRAAVCSPRSACEASRAGSPAAPTATS